MDPMKLFTSVVMTAVLGTAVVKSPTDTAPEDKATTLAADWPAIPSYKPTIDVPTPEPDVVPDTPDESDTPIKQPESYRPEPKESDGCNCENCLTEADVRRIAAEEYLVQKQVDMQQMRGVRSNGSTGGSISAVVNEYVVSNGLTGGSTGSTGGRVVSTSSSGYYSSPATTFRTSIRYSTSELKSIAASYNGPMEAHVQPQTYVWQHLQTEHGFAGDQVSGLSQQEALAIHSMAHGGRITPYRSTASQVTYSASPTVQTVTVTPRPVFKSLPPRVTVTTQRVAVGTRNYVDAEGCTVRETTYSDGTVSRQKISCPNRTNTRRTWR